MQYFFHFSCVYDFFFIILRPKREIERIFYLRFVDTIVNDILLTPKSNFMRKIFLFFMLVLTSVSVLATEGALAGKFTINANGDQVVFSQGNLQWQASTQTYRFATNQWDTIGADNVLRSERYDGWIDLLGYGKGSNPYNYPMTYAEMDSTVFDDYGNHPISNGGNQAGLWRTLKLKEWYYIVSTRTGASQKKGQATINGVHGLVLLPDEWTQPARITFTPSPNNWTTNVYSEREWYLMAANGAVFMPATGVLNPYDTTIASVNVSGLYVAISYNSGGGNGPLMYFSETQIIGGCAAFLGRMFAVRLVQDVVVPPAPTCPEGRFYSNGAEVTSLTVNVGASVSVPMLLTATGNVVSGGRLTIEDTSVAQVTADNMIHGVAAGTTVLHVLTATTINGQVLTCDYALPITVEASAILEPTCPEAHFNLNGAEVMTLHVGDVVSIPTLMGATGSIYRLSSKTVEGIRVAELTDDDMIHATGVGTATFIGLYIHTENGQTIHCEYSFSIVVEAGVQLQDPELSFTPAEVEAEVGAPFTAPTLNNPHNVPIDKWYGSNNLVLTVDEQTGAVTIVGVGTAQVYCESNATDTYKRSAAYYTVNVTTMGLVVGGVTVTNSNAGDIFGNGSISYDKITHTLTMTNAVVSAPISPLGVPSVQGAPQDNTQGAAIEYTLRNEPLTIMLNGGNAINNTAIGIMASFAPVVIRSTNYGSLRMSANTVTVKAPALKISQCTVTAYSNSTGIGVETLSVDKGSMLVADGQSMAIQAQYFEKASDNNGEGIDILTAGVEFVAKKGFYNTADNTYAKHVEIGKVVVVPTIEEVTTIDFTQTDPEGNETVIFSGSVNDTYNESTGQLEISTSLTDEEVAWALESVIPGSSAWIDLLPGSLVFDIPAGQGKIRVQCMTLPGYSLQVKMEGQAAVSITQTELGWAEVNYNVTEPIHVVIYLHAASPSSAPARIATNMQDGEPNVGAYIQAVKIAPQGAPDPNPQTAIDMIETNQSENGKVMMNGVLYILRDGKIFNALGMEIR